MKNSNDKLYKIHEYLKKCNDYKDKNDMMNFLSNKHKNITIFNDELLFDILTIIIDNNLYFEDSYLDAIALYDDIVYDENDNKQIEIFKRFFIQYETNINVFSSYSQFSTIYSLFENKELLLSILKKLQTKGDIDSDILEYIYNYMIMARRFYIDETAYFSSISCIIDKILINKHSSIVIKQIIEEELEKDKKLAGLYEIDIKEINENENKLKEVNEKQVYLKEQLENIKNLVNQFLSNSDSKIEEVKKMFDEYNNELNLQNQRFDDHINENIVKDTSFQTYNSFLSNPYNPNLYSVITEELEKIRTELKLPNYNEKTDNIMINYLKNIFSSTLDNPKSIIKRNHKYFVNYYIALYNETLNVFMILKDQTDIEKLPNFVFDKDVVNSFEIKVYIDLVLNNFNILSYFYHLGKIYMLSQMMDINKNFISLFSNSKFLEDRVFSIDKVVEIFGIEEVANYNEIFIKNIEEILVPGFDDFLNSYKKIYDINKNFIIYQDACLRIENLLKIEEIAYLDEKAQKMISKLCYGDVISDFNSEQLKEIIFNKGYIVYDYDISFLLNSHDTYDISLDQYIDLDYNKQQELKKLCEGITKHKPIIDRLAYGHKIKKFIKNNIKK